MRWYLPTWNGDIRLAEDGEKTKMTIIEPTAVELMKLGALEAAFRERGWWKLEEGLWVAVKDKRRREAKRQEVLVDAKLADVAPLLVDGYSPGEQTLSAIVYKDGEVETVDGTEGKQALAEVAKMAVSSGAEKAATVKRATPSCPQCMPGAVEAASEVLLDFLDEEQHASWAEHRRFVVRGGITGHPYLLAHRHSPTAVGMGRPCMDLADQVVLHFHDQSVPPEEEVLGAKLVLEHREPWLRNQATVLGPGVDTDGARVWDRKPEAVFDNPFGDHMDGVADAVLTQALGGFFAGIGSGIGIDDPDLARVMEEAVRDLGNLGMQVGIGLDPEQAQFLELAKRLGRLSPDALAELTLYYRMRACGEDVEEPALL